MKKRKIQAELHSPFLFGQTVNRLHFTNREEELKKLKSNFRNGINTIIISPRRWGKSSLVERTIFEMQDDSEIRFIPMDLFTVSDETSFLKSFAKAVLESTSNQWQDWMEIGKKFLSQFSTEITIGNENQAKIKLNLKDTQQPLDAEEILELPQKIATEKNIKIVICLDEFQNLSEFKNYENLEKKMRAVWQKQKDVTYCIYGSKRHMMEDIFNHPSKPFYRFGDVFLLSKIRKEKWVSYIEKGFERTEKEIPTEVAEKIPEWMNNHSWYVQQLSHYVWNLTHKKATLEIAQQALKNVIFTNEPFFMRIIDGLSKTQTNLLKAIAMGETVLSGKKTMQTYDLGTPRNVSKNKKKLMHQDLIDVYEKRFEFLDPAFELWFRYKFLEQNIVK